MVINTLLYGGPLSTGYGSLFELYSLSSLPLNVRNYVVWLVQTQTPLILLALVPLFVRRALREGGAGLSPRACLAAIVGLTFLSYLFYATFDHWFYLRFLLPAYPALFVLLAAAIRWLALKLPRRSRACRLPRSYARRWCRSASMSARREGIFNVASYEQRHIRAAREVASRTPADAVVLSVQHSGSVRYYANRITLRYDWLEDGALDAALRDLAAKGRRAYLVVDDWEEKEFRARFSPGKPRGAPRLGAHRARAGQPRSAHFRVAGRRPCSDPMKKGALVFLIYCVVTVALTYPLILQMGSVLPNDAGDPALNTWILWWNTQTVPFSTAVVERAGVFSRARGAEFFGEPAGAQSDFDAAPLAWRGTADGVQRRVSSDVPAQRSWRIPARVRADETARRGIHCGIAVRLRAVSHRAPAADPVARVVSRCRSRCSACIAICATRGRNGSRCLRAGWFLQGLCNGYYLLFFSVFVGLWILWFASPWSRPQAVSCGQPGVGHCRDSDAAAPAALSRHSRVVRVRARLRHHQGLRRRRGEPAARDRRTSRCGVGCDVFRRPEGELFPGLTVALLVLAGAAVRARSAVRRTSTAGRSRGAF